MTEAQNLDSAVKALEDERPDIAGVALCRLFTPLLTEASHPAFPLSRKCRSYFTRAITVLATSDCEKSASVFTQGLRELKSPLPEHKALQQQGLALASNLSQRNLTEAAINLRQFGISYSRLRSANPKLSS